MEERIEEYEGSRSLIMSGVVLMRISGLQAQGALASRRSFGFLRNTLKLGRSNKNGTSELELPRVLPFALFQGLLPPSTWQPGKPDLYSS